VAIIPLGPGSHRNSSSLPEGPDELGSSPLLFGLAPRGVCRASDVAIGAVSSYPTVSPLPGTIAFCNPLSRLAFRPAEGFPSAGHRGACTGRFVFCGTVRSRKPRLAFACCTKSRPPGVTRRVALWTRAFPPRTTVSGLSSRLAFFRRPAQRSPGLPALCIIAYGLNFREDRLAGVLGVEARP